MKNKTNPTNMIQLPAIVTFANQKGGVGKTTLCVLFAHYLVSKGVKVRVFDCDRQRSVDRRRRADIERYGGEQIPFPVTAADVNSNKEVFELIKEILENFDYEITGKATCD